ncbi:uracil-DNA glycosylase [Shewanella glacialipiscicola]|uniref:Uracil-DNA glycosylase n=1 Tax=Shewanella glacialipiscicola TaxID=614069 RepID=A0ABQ6J8I6_9GAMM|nr:uracil-DNA glycosylase [Shewanella glacialipiscicola]MCL1086828.1 uracil-DNA glycosylase [Shewanella glacialipiscicola]MCU7995393.1 uracil-DNA glycosylase [Shewanella glacialipiscicola]MCU8025601.1 uracil-DNA glycosylase [Shewanella glacialipiscicola]GIU09896.1 uracil-DNA glycosylase [Shewanella glacialipiscicola]GMA83140.1 uracil-DNA glycosylase [Shewanella glacialipiscicola]
MTLATWQAFINDQKALPYFQQLSVFVDNERRAGKVVYPPETDIFNAFNITPLENVRVVLIGQDPYHGPNQAHGLCFSVKRGIKPPPSLANMYKELATDITGFLIPSHGDLSAWAEQGVLMLNTVLTVEQGKAHSHAKAGWETFTAAALGLLNRQTQPIIFILWGSHAIKKGQVITAPQHHVLTGPHPSPLSAYRGFFGCGHFSQVNQLLLERGEAPIRWQV